MMLAGQLGTAKDPKSYSKSMREERTQNREAEIARDLVHRIEHGDRTAEGKLIERYSRGLLYMLRRTTGNPPLADDLHQETFRIVLERLRSRGLGEPEKLTGFIHRTARNLFIADHRKFVRRQTQNDEDAMHTVADPSPSQLGQVLGKEEAELIRQLILELKPDRDRQILLRFYLAEEDKEKICADLGLSSLHFNRVLFRARQRFKDLLERFEKKETFHRAL